MVALFYPIQRRSLSALLSGAHQGYEVSRKGRLVGQRRKRKVEDAVRKGELEMATIDVVAELNCCGLGLSFEASARSVDVPGGEVARAACTECGKLYLLGVIVEAPAVPAAVVTSADSDERFEEVPQEILDQAGIDDTDFDESPLDAAMCARCDGDVRRAIDYCEGCREYVCAVCRVRQPGSAGSHHAEEHWQAPLAAGGFVAEAED